MRYLVCILLLLFICNQSLAATVTVTIGTSARTRATVTLWEANSYDATGSDNAIGEMYADSDFDESVLTINDATPIDIILRAATGERHDGTANSGVRNLAAGEDSWIIDATGTIMTIEWIEFDWAGNAHGGSGTGAIFLSSNVANVFRNNIIHDVVEDNRDTRGIFDLTSGNGIITNNMIYDLSNTQTPDDVIGIDGGAANSIMNNTVHNVFGIASTTGTVIGIRFSDTAGREVQNNIVTDTTVGTPVQDYSPSTVSNATVDHNLSSDTTATGTGSLTSKTSANQFVSTTGGSEDLHLKTGADAIDAGTDLGTTPSGVEIDIDGRDRDAEGDTWDMGAHEFISVGGVVFIPQVRWF